MIAVRLQLDSGHEIKLSLSENAPELAALFRILASRGSDAVEPVEQFLQVPLDGGKAACSFNSRQLVSIITEPPVVVQLEQAPQREPAVPEVAQAPDPVVVNSPRYLVIDDFLSPDEYRDMLDFALSQEERFESGTVVGKQSPHRQNKVIMNFDETAHSRLLCNRLLTCLPVFARELKMPLFPVGRVESQLTASNDGHYYRVHADAGDQGTDDRTLTCVYYFFREPRPFSGGALRLYDAITQGAHREATRSYREIEAVSNRLVVFHSAAFHELMPIRCPSRSFGDSRFAVTNWVQSTSQPDQDATFGWGHLHCGLLPDALATRAGQSS
jgi:Rps23 Pro-64 3,4-dihydroxylase Tpa1-like proline 4-hydroxylase